MSRILCQRRGNARTAQFARKNDRRTGSTQTHETSKLLVKPAIRVVQQARRYAAEPTESRAMTRSETDDMPMAGGHYSHGLRAGDFVYTAGQVPRDSRRNVIGTTIEEQTAATLENVGRVLRSFGATFDNVVKATVHLSDVANAPRFNAVYARYFPNNKPVRTLTGSQLNGVLVEVE